MSAHHTTFAGKISRLYQVAAAQQTVLALREGHTRIAIVLPTGAGKTQTAGLLLTDPELKVVLGIEVDQPLRVLFIAHRHRLLTQAEISYGSEMKVLDNVAYKNTPMCTSFSGEWSSSQVLLKTCTTSSELPKDLQWDIVILDECHHESMLTFQYKLEQVAKTPIIGLTATEERHDGTLCKFSKFIETISREDAVAAGFLADSSLYSFIDSPSREHVDMVMDIIDLKKSVIGQTMVFVRTRAEAIEVNARLKKLGFTSTALVDIKESVLNAELAKFEKKEIQFVISCNKIGEGTDVKGCESIVIGRITQSLPLLNQLIGRSARIDCESKIYEIINPLSNKNISTTAILEPHHHEIWYKVRHQWRHHVVV